MRHRPIRAVSGVALHNIEIFTFNESLPFANRLRPAAACADVFWCRDERRMWLGFLGQRLVFGTLR
jgi:hypothetical protein